MLVRPRFMKLVAIGCVSVGLALLAASVAAFPIPGNPWLSRKGEGSPAEADEYYAQLGAPATFELWQAAYMAETGAVRAVYSNAGDLGFGRDMHCSELASIRVACYVINHGLGPGAPTDVSVEDARTVANTLPTVAMTYIAGSGVSFYVYDPAGNLINQVALDSEGPKNVPHLCLACHGGTYDETTNVVTSANFLPFDGESFDYSTQPGFTRPDQEQALRQLNAMVMHTSPAAPIAALIQGWYAGSGGVDTPGAVQHDGFVPPDYNANPADQELYNEVVKPYCRGCHIAQGTNLGAPAQLDGARSAVFGSFDMPHAELTSHKFWTSPAPAVLARNRGWSFHVTSLADAAPNGCDADCTLREAILAANAYSDPFTTPIVTFGVTGTIELSYGASGEDFASEGDLDITRSLIILGNGAAQTIIDGDGRDRVFHILDSADVILQGVTVQGGLVAGMGGGIRNDGSTLTLNLSVLRDNTADQGGGLAVSGGDAYLNQSTLGPSNMAEGQGGGLYSDNAGIVEIRNSTISSNTAEAGGGLYTDQSSQVTLVHTTVAFNTGGTGAGGWVLNDAFGNLGNSLLIGNTSSEGESDCDLLGASSHFFAFGYNLLGQHGEAGGCPGGPDDEVLAGAVGDALQTTLFASPPTGVPVHLPHRGGPALDAIPNGPDCTPPSYDARNAARPRDADGNGTAYCDIGAVELGTGQPIDLPQRTYLPLVRR